VLTYAAFSMFDTLVLKSTIQRVKTQFIMTLCIKAKNKKSLWNTCRWIPASIWKV